MIGTLRAAQAAIVGVLVRELGHDGERSILRRASLRDAFNSLHAAEIAAIKIAPHAARDITRAARLSGNGELPAPTRRLALQRTR